MKHYQMLLALCTAVAVMPALRLTRPTRRLLTTIARWHIDARFGHKQTVIDAVKKWSKEIASQIGWTADNLRIATGSIGALESTVEMDVVVRDLASLSASWEKLGAIPAHNEWSKQREPHIVSGTPRWGIFRIIE
jgi:hypothetical protein